MYQMLQEMVKRKIPVCIKLDDATHTIISEKEVIRDTLDGYVMLSSGLSKVTGLYSNKDGTYTVKIKTRS